MKGVRELKEPRWTSGDRTTQVLGRICAGIDSGQRFYRRQERVRAIDALREVVALKLAHNSRKKVSS